jgi:hypothetical protein
VSCDTGGRRAAGSADRPAIRICVTLSATATADSGAERVDVGGERADHADHQVAGTAVAADAGCGQPLGFAQGGAQGVSGQHQHDLLERAVEGQGVRPGAVVEREVAGREQRVAAVLRDDAPPSVWMLTRK